MVPPLFIRGGPIRAYVVSSLSTIRIDGLFADWVGKDVVDSDPAQVKNPDVDIVRSGTVIGASTSYFHVAVDGTLLDGRVPERINFSPPGSGGSGTSRPIPLPRQTGEDLLRVYVDVNTSDSQGEPVAGIRADYLLEVRGRGGRITSYQLYTWTGLWSNVVNPNVTISKNATDFEGSLPIIATSQTKTVIATTDWSGIGDMTGILDGVGPAPVRSLRAPSDNTNPWPSQVHQPIALDISGNGVFWFRDTDSTETSCTRNKVAMSTQGSGLAKTISLNAGDTACWYIDETSGQTIPAGDWETLLDIPLSTTTYDVRLEVWTKGGGIPELIGSCTFTTTGDDVRCPVTLVAQKIIASNQVIRIVVANSGAGTVSIVYDDVASTGDSRATLPIPEFGDIAIPVLAVIAVSVIVRRRRREL